MKKHFSKIIILTILFFYIGIVLCITLFTRKGGLILPNFDLFWSYRSWLNGDAKVGIQIIENIGLFIPLGFISASLFYNFFSAKYSRRKCILFALVIGFIVSLSCEFCQYYFGLGLCELDDLFDNTLGSLIGGLSFVIILHLINKKSSLFKNRVILSINILMLLIGGIGCEYYRDTTNIISSRYNIVFQIDELSRDDDQLQLQGFCFSYDDYPLWLEKSYKNSSRPSEYDFANSTMILIDSVTGEQYALDTAWHMETQAVDAYYGGEMDCSHTGFLATIDGDVIDWDAKYIIAFKCRGILIEMRYYIKGDKLVNMDVAGSKLPDIDNTDIGDILDNGTLLVARPDFDCWVYQLGNELYWVAGENFYFEDDGSTYIQYQMTTTQFANLSEERLENEWYWSNIGGNFEDYEITNQLDCGDYRVMKREIPSEYSVCEVDTGYYANGRWVWKEIFSPRMVN